jgi:hypothetical protein
MTPSRPSLPQRLPASLTYNDLNGGEAVEILCDWFRQLLKSHPLMQPHLTLPMAVLDLKVQVGVDMYIGGSVPVSSPPEHLDIGGGVKLTNEIPGSGAAPSQLQYTEQEFRATVNAAPIPGGLPPDKVREQHGLQVPRPGYGSRDTGSHMFLADVPDPLAGELQREVSRLAAGTTVPDAASSTGGRRGDVADGYVFSSEVVTQPGGKQVIPVDNGSIRVDMEGEAIQHAGLSVSAGTHVSSAKVLGDQRGKPYESVNGVMDAGPRGLMRPGRGAGGLYTDGRPRLSFGNSHRGS